MSHLYEDLGGPDTVYLDGFDVLASYDETIKDLINIPVTVPFTYTKDELLNTSVDDLRKIADGRNVFSQTESKLILVNSILNSQKIPVSIASPNNAWGRPEFVTGIKNPGPEANKAFNPSYPMISVTRLSVRPDYSRFNTGHRRKIAWTDDGNAVLQADAPAPITVPYQIDAFSTSFKHANLIDVSILRIFWNVTRVVIDHGNPWGKIPIHLLLDQNVRDASQLEASSDRAEKLIRHVYSVNLDGWITNEANLVRTVRTIRTDVVDHNFATGSDDTLLTVDKILPNTYL